MSQWSLAWCGLRRGARGHVQLKVNSKLNLTWFYSLLPSFYIKPSWLMRSNQKSGGCWGDRQSKLRKRRRARLGRASRMTFPGGIREIFNKVSAVNWFCQQVHGFSQSEASFKSPVWKATRLISILYTNLRLQYPVFPLCQLSFSRLRANLGSKHWRTLVCCPLTFSSFGLAVERSLAW